MIPYYSGKRVFGLVPAALVILLLLSSCTTSRPAVVDSREVAYNAAMEEMKKKEYDRAALKLEELMFSTRATPLEDKVLHALGQAYFQTKQYLLASEIYGRLLQQTPDSPFARDAQYQLARSYEKLSPRFELDQEYTVKAINEFRVYLDQYPQQESDRINSDVETYRELLKLKPDNQDYRARYDAAMAELASQSPARYCMAAIPVLREKLAHNRASIADHYARLRKYRAAGAFYDQVIAGFADTIWFEPAWMGKIEMAVKRGKWFEARQAIEQYQQTFPDKSAKVDALYKKVLKNFTAP